MMKLFMKLLEKMGRKYTLVHFDGEIVVHKYCVLYNELPGYDKWFPNIYIHHFVSKHAVDGEDFNHVHPWNTLSVILKNGYKEVRNGKNIERKAGSVMFQKHTETHSIVEMIPDTITLFAHWFKKHDWEFRLNPCETLCNRCKTEFGVCQKTLQVTTPKHTVEIEGNKETPRWKAHRWVKWTPEVEKRARIRRKAIEKLGDLVKIKPLTPVQDLHKSYLNNKN